ncbi:MAG: hypothetical protein AAB719_00390 [Patescibacteria group bacterium]
MQKITIAIVTGLVFILPFNSNAQTLPDPIIIVPGIMGSWNSEVILSSNTGVGTWSFFPLDHTWDNIISALEDAGYERDLNLFVAFYDWRQSNINSATDYLIPTIDQALLNSPTGKINIIAHSMGGLVARRYIQSHNYRGDVNELIMLGTPNYGSSDVYTLWEGGFVPKNWDFGTRIFANNVIDILNIKDITTDDEYDTVHKYIPSIGELLPVYDFLVDSENENNLKTYDGLIEAQNPFLANLNFSGTGVELQGLSGITVVAGRGEGTVGNIPVVGRPVPETKLWADGRPEPLSPAQDNMEGDNRILLSSAHIDEIVFPISPARGFWDKLFALFSPKVHAQLPEEEFLKHIEIDSKHGDLPTTAIDYVFDALGIIRPIGDFVPPPEPDNITSFWLASPVEVKITDPQGRVITRDSNNVPDAVYTGESDPNGVKIIIIPNGPSGDYEIELTGMADGEYHMGVSNLSDVVDETVITQKNVVEGEIVEYTANINHEALSSSINLSEPTVTEPETDSPVDLTKALISRLKDYYENGAISSKGVYQSLFNHLKIALAALEEVEIKRPIGEKHQKLHELKVALAKRLAQKTLKSFISEVKKQNSKDRITNEATQNLISSAEAIIIKVD